MQNETIYKNIKKEKFMKQIQSNLLGVLIALAGIFVIIYISFFSTVIKDSFLHETNRKFHIAEKLHMTDEDLDAVTTSMVSFVMGKNDVLQVEVTMEGIQRGFFNEKEIVHIEDVRDLIQNLHVFIVMCGVIFCIGTFYLWRKGKLIYLAKGYFVGLLLILALVLLVGVFVITDITAVINGFHYLFFDNDLWIMNPMTDKVVYLFTEDMYLDAIIRIGSCLGGMLFITTIGATIILKKSKK